MLVQYLLETLFEKQEHHLQEQGKGGTHYPCCG